MRIIINKYYAIIFNDVLKPSLNTFEVFNGVPDAVTIDI